MAAGGALKLLAAGASSLDAGHVRTADVWPRLARLSVVVVMVGLMATGVLAWLSYTINQRNEARLLSLQTKQTGALLEVVFRRSRRHWRRPPS